MLTPLIGTIEALGAADVPISVLTEQIVELFVREVYETRRKDVIRLMISEGRRFPEARRILLSRGSVAHHRRGARVCCAAPPRAARCLRRWPSSRRSSRLQAWWRSSGAGCSNDFEPLDVRKMMKTHVELLFAPRRAP